MNLKFIITGEKIDVADGHVNTDWWILSKNPEALDLTGTIDCSIQYTEWNVPKRVKTITGCNFDSILTRALLIHEKKLKYKVRIISSYEEK